MKRSKTLPKNNRIIIFFITISLLFTSLSIRLYYLQVFKKDEFTSAALSQRGKRIPLDTNRGMIFDRNLLPLTNNNKTPNLIILKETLKKPSVYNYIKRYTSLNLYELENKVKSKDIMLKIPLKEKINLDYLGKDVFLVDIVDRYNKEGFLSHVIGYINENDNMGEAGIEKTHDEFLKTEPRESFVVEYDNARKFILDGSYNVNNNINPSDPSGVKLTIDYGIQREVESIIDQNKMNGAVIVSEVKSGEILALASRPNFNPERVEDYLEDEDMALYNKAIQNKYPPGSVFKIVVLLAALEETPDIVDRSFFCEGFEEINGRRINCNNTHGVQSLKETFSDSCNSAFIQIAKEIGGEKILEVSKRLGFGSKMNIGLMEEIEGNLPEIEETYGVAIGNLAIGQGNIEVTPLQITNLLTTIANDGIKKQITLVKAITNTDGKTIKEYFKEKDVRVISYLNASILKEFLIDVVKNGTAKSMNLEMMGGAGGKTGSSQANYNGYKTIHGWFSGFYPEKNPKYVITIINENTSKGSEDAIPIFKEIIKKLK